MTCIAGLLDKQKDKTVVWMGGDSAGTTIDFSQIQRADGKVFRKGDFLFGFTSSFRMGQLLRYGLVVPQKHNDTDLYEYMVTSFINAVRQCLKDGGYTKVENSVERGGHFLVGYQGRLFKIESDFQVGESILPYNATGCGQDMALGSLYSTEGKPSEERILTALRAAQQFSAGVREPFHVLNM